MANDGPTAPDVNDSTALTIPDTHYAPEPFLDSEITWRALPPLRRIDFPIPGWEIWAREEMGGHWTAHIERRTTRTGSGKVDYVHIVSEDAETCERLLVSAMAAFGL